MSTNIFGNAPNQVPTNADLGGMAYQDPRFVVIAGGNVNPTNFGTSNAQILAGSITGLINLAATYGNVLNASIGNLVATNFSAANINMTGTTVTSGTVQITNATDSTGPTSGALRITGGVGIAANLHVGGNLFVTGNTFTLSTEDLRVQDSIIELHTFANLAPLTTNDGRDIGVKMHYYDTQDSHAFLGRANDTGYLEWYDRGIEGFGNIFQGNTYGTIKAGGALLVNATVSTSTTTGALVVTGGVGIGDGLYVNGSSWFQNVSSSNIMLTGGSITGTTGAFTTLVSTNFSSANIYQSAADTLVATNFSAGNIYQTGTSQSIQTANAQIGTDWGDTSRANLLVANVRTLHATAGNLTTANVKNFSSANIFLTGTDSIQVSNAAILGGNIGMDYNRTVTAIGNIYTTTGHAVNFSSGNVSVNGNILVGPSGASGTGSAAPFGNLIITGNAYINNPSQDLSANSIATRGYVESFGIIFGV